MINASLIRAIEPEIVLVAETHGRCPVSGWAPDIVPFSTRLNETERKGLLAAQHYVPALSAIANRLCLRRFLKRLVDERVDVLFAPVGADIYPALRAAWLAREAGSRLSLYFVDDIVASYAVNAGDAIDVATMQRQVDSVLAVTDYPFFVTDALALKMTAPKGSKPWRRLNLPFTVLDGAPRASPLRNREIVHIGAINHIYEAGVLSVARVIHLLNARGAGLSLRLTTRPSSPRMREQLEALTPYVDTPINTGGQLAEVLARALCAVVPILAEPSGMYATSFPSKTLEYLNACRTVVAYGPPEASAVSYFREAHIEYIVSDEAELAAQLSSLLAASPDLSESYRKTLLDNHSHENLGKSFKAVFQA